MDNAEKQDRLKALETVLNSSFAFQLNMSDTFAFACADVEELSIDDFEKMASIVAQYGRPALVAYTAVRRNARPIQCPCGHDGPDFEAALKAVEELKKTDQDFMAY